MPYEQEYVYLNTFDPTQSPVWMAMVAKRHGVTTANSLAQTSDRLDRPITYMDLGCASGHTVLSLAPLYPQVNFIGVDFNTHHIAQANKEAQRIGLKNTTFVQGDFRSFPKDLPEADQMVVRGIYSWLTPEVKSALECVMAEHLQPNGLVKLHYAVRPGGLVREILSQVLTTAEPTLVRQAGGQERIQNARNFAKSLQNEAPLLNQLLPKAQETWEGLQKNDDSLWIHDILSEDFTTENAHAVIERLQTHGLHRVAASQTMKNLPELLIKPVIRERMQALTPARAQTLQDYVCAEHTRDDVFVKSGERSTGTYRGPWRFGVLMPPNKLLASFKVPQGELKFADHTGCKALLDALSAQPRTYDEMLPLFKDTKEGPDKLLTFWLDHLMAANRVGPFLPESTVVNTDRERLRQINRVRLKQSVRQLTAQTQTPLLAAEYGNCLVAGWFESLVMAHFDARNTAAGQKKMLDRMHQANLRFPGPDRKPAPDQMAVFQAQLKGLEDTYIPKMAYWGIEV